MAWRGVAWCGVAMSDSCNVKVYCRFRPFNDRELAIGADQNVDLDIQPGKIVIHDPSSGRPRTFPMDAAFKGDCRQVDVFDTDEEQPNARGRVRPGPVDG